MTLSEPIELSVDSETAGIRLDRWLADQVVNLTRSRLQGLIKDGALRRDGEPFTNAAWKIRLGEHYRLTVPAAVPLAITPQQMPLDIIFEDAHLIVINKPPGIVVHPGAGNQDGTLVNALMAHCGDSLSGIGGVARPGIVHRIDKDTSGLIVIAKHDEAHLGLSALFAEHDIERAYVAIIHGALRPGVGTIHTLIGRSKTDRKKMAVIDEADTRPDAREAITHFKTLHRYGTSRAKLPGDALASLIECRLETGRTHQIRVHMQHLGAGLLGDQVYGRGPGLGGLKPGDPASDHALKTLRKFLRQALHAKVLGFVHPITHEALYFEAELPKDFADLVAALAAL